MARVNITVPDELLVQARAAGLNVSRAAVVGLTEGLDRLEKIAEVDRYLQELENEHGPIPEEDVARAEAWISQVLPGADRAA